MADDTDAGEKTFTQADLDRVVRERLARERDKYKDYDDLKASAADAEKNKSALEQLLTKVSGLEERATKAEALALRADVAQAKGLTPAQARRLQGSSREELEADADELLSMFRPAEKDSKDGKDGGDTRPAEGTGKPPAGDGKPAESGQLKTGGDGQERKLPPSGRPKETLTPGAVPSAAGEQSAAALAESILKSDF